MWVLVSFKKLVQFLPKQHLCTVYFHPFLNTLVKYTHYPSALFQRKIIFV